MSFEKILRKIKHRYVHAGIRICRGSLERRHQTTVESRVMRTYCGRLLKFIRCVHNKLAGSSDVGSAGDRVCVGHYGNRK